MIHLSKKEIENELVSMKQKKSKKINSYKKLSFTTLSYAVLLFYSLISLFPFFWSVIASFKNPYLLDLTGINPFPDAGQWTTQNYDNLFGGAAKNFLGNWISNTILYSFVSAILNSIFNLLAGYALANIAMRGKKIILSYFMVSILVPSQATFLPSYFIYSKLGIISNEILPSTFLIAVIFSGMANIILTFMARQFFLSQTNEMEESAGLDGYSKISSFMRITIRRMLPLFTTQFVLVFMGAWNNFLLFTLFATGDPYKMTLNSGITVIASSGYDKELGYGQLLAMSNLSFLPMIFVYGLSLKIQLRGMKGGNK